MSRLLIQIVIPLMAPIVIYSIWSAYDRRGRGLTGLPSWEEGRWFWAAMTGFVLVVAIFVLTMVFNRGNDGDYVPAVFEDGKVVPGRFTGPDKPKP